MIRRWLIAMLLLLAMATTAFGGETRFHQLVLKEEGSEDPYIEWRTADGTLIANLIGSDQDANAVCMVLDFPEGGAVTVPGLVITDAETDFGFFDGETEPFIALIDDDGDSWVRLTFTTDDNPAIEVGGSASSITLPGTVSGYTATDDLDWGFGTGTAASMEWTTADANANLLVVDLPTGGATDVPVFLLSSADADDGWYNGIVEPTLSINNLAASGYVKLGFSGTTLAQLATGQAATALSIVSPIINLTGTTNVGVDGTGYDVTLFGDTANYKIWWDQNGDTNGSLFLGADDYGVDVEFYGVTADYNVSWDASADAWLYGADDHGVDVTFFGAGTGNYIKWDETLDTLVAVDGNIKLDDDAIVYLGTGTNVTTADGDFTINFTDGAPGLLTITAVTNDDSLQIGDGTIGTDILIQNTTTAGADISWDDSGEIWSFGVDNLGVDVKFFGDGTGNYLIYDESIDTLVSVDSDVKLDDDAMLLFGTGTNVTTADGDFTMNFTDGSPGYFTVTATVAEDVFQVGDGTIATDFLIQNTTTATADIFWDDSGELWKFGIDNFGVDVGFYGDTAGDFILFDESADELIVEDVTTNIMDDTILSFGDGDDVTMNYDEDGDNDLQITGPVTFEGAVVVQSTLTMTGTSGTWDPGSLVDGAQESRDFTVSGAALGDAAFAGAGVDVVDILVSCVVTATDTVTVTLANETAGTVDLASSTWYVYVILDD